MLNLAFETLSGVKIFSSQTGRGYIFSDYITVYEDGTDSPFIYSWSAVKQVVEQRDSISITIDSTVYDIDRLAFGNNETYLKARAIIEGQIACYPDIEYRPMKRILPLKTIYSVCEMPDNAYVATGTYSEREINSGNVSLMNTIMSKFLWLAALLSAAALFLILNNTIGDFDKNWFYFIPISLFGGIGVGVLFHLATSLIAKYKYSELYRTDPAISEEITFIVCKEGFGAVETGCYTASDLIPWTQASYYIETNFVYVIMNNKRTIFWLPKRLFPKEMQSGLGDFIAARVPQK